MSEVRRGGGQLIQLVLVTPITGIQRRRRRVPSPAIALAINIAFDTGSNTAGDDDDAICAPRSGTSKGANRGTPLFPLYYEGAKVRRLIPYCERVRE